MILVLGVVNDLGGPRGLEGRGARAVGVGNPWDRESGGMGVGYSRVEGTRSVDVGSRG